MLLDKVADFGNNVHVLQTDGTGAVYRMQNGSGDGMMHSVEVLPGIVLMKNDFHMGTCASHFHTSADMLCIDHCREGRIEWDTPAGTCYYVEAGDLNISTRRHHVHDFTFPLRHYHGITIGIVLDEAAEGIVGFMPDFPVDLYALRDKFCCDELPFITVASRESGFDITGLYTIPKELQLPYYRVKVLELLMHLATLEMARAEQPGRYFYKTQVQKIKSIMAFMTARPEEHHTLESLSARFAIPLTTMKQCFKGVYGASIYAYMRRFRMNAAALRLRQSDDSVAQIAQQFGYDNASKFSAAFKSVLGDTPANYRHSH